MPKSRRRKNVKKRKLQSSYTSPQTKNSLQDFKSGVISERKSGFWDEFNEGFYPDGKFDLHQEVSPPSYEAVMGWMKDSSARHITFDYWARGNYTRRLIHNRNKGINPLLVPVRYVDEMRWAYRRLTLLGLPVEFIYCGQESKTGTVAHLCPTDIMLDSGWGYIACLDPAAMVRRRGREWFPILGYGRMMPEPLLDWIVEEAPNDFIEGKVFLSPAEQIGIDSRGAYQNLDKLAKITRGAPLTPDYEVVQAAIELNIPFLDGLSPDAFRKFLNDYEGELIRFQRAFRNVITEQGKSEGQLKEYIDELKYEIAELTVSAKHHDTRKNIAKLGGIVATFTASLAMAVKAMPDSMLPIVGAAGAGAATAALLDLWKQATERDQSLSENPYFILWKLGLSRPSEVKRVSKAKFAKVPKLASEQFGIHKAYHWLCPPTNGISVLVEEIDKSKSK